MSISDMMSKHTIVDVNEHIHVVDGKGNTYAVITGMKSDRTKSISMQGMHHFSSEIMKKVNQAVLEYAALKNKNFSQ